MRKITIIFVLVGLCLAGISSALAQGLPRSTGIGFRGGSWGLKATDDDEANIFSLNFSGFGGSLFFFTRFHDRMFFELSMSGVVDTRIKISNVESSNMNAVLLGMRYDLLPLSTTSVIQPYVNLGIGAYMMTRSSVGLNINLIGDAKFSMYAGLGANLILAKWIGLNFHMNQHFVNLTTTSMENLTGSEFGMGLFFMWGKRREIFRVEEVKVIVRDIYPAYYQFYNTYPIAMVAVRNSVRYPIEVNIRSSIQGYTERETESGFRRIEPGETVDVPIHALFGSQLLNANQREPAVIDLEVEARGGAVHKQSLSAHVMVHNRNAWNGEIDKLAFFITPEDERVLEMSRTVEERMTRTGDRSVPALAITKELFNVFMSQGLRYRTDPNIPFYKDDRVQFASETMDLMTGDCDDLVVLFSSLLESVGISTAFIDVEDPAKELAHVYLMFDTGLTREDGYLVSPNEKRYVVRGDSSGRRTVWVPLETTLIHEGFDAAWQAGARTYLEEGILRHGIADGWVKIIDVD